VTTAMIGSIGRNSLHDGPGIRTTVFFKGCPLRCLWCHNPELQEHNPELSFQKQLCIGCGDCANICPADAITVEKTAHIHASACTNCMDCVDECPSGALKTMGSTFHLDELMEIILRDRHYYLASGGGVTLSGGEPTSQLDFALQLTQRLREKNIHTAIETCGYYTWDEKAKELFDALDLIYFDMKIADSKQHKQFTGHNNNGIIENLRRLVSRHKEKVIVSIPLIPQYTASEKNLVKLGELITEIGIMRTRLLPYHPFGLETTRIAKNPTHQPILPTNSMNQKELSRWRQLFERYNFEVN
jgi:pyruvate formate lyase activating enzyme